MAQPRVGTILINIYWPPCCFPRHIRPFDVPYSRLYLACYKLESHTEHGSSSRSDLPPGHIDISGLSVQLDNNEDTHTITR